ncbi:MAG: ChaN family lipoprotein [Desulfuromonadales bacterium]
MKSMRILTLSVLVAGSILLQPPVTQAHPHILDVAGDLEISFVALLDDLRRAQVIFMGEFHDHVGHHNAQLAVIDALDDDDERPLAIGLEMFRKDSQAVLDRWTGNDLPFLQFLSVYNDNWSMWQVYREIFLHARNEGVKMLGLNIPRSLSSKVARDGFQSLSLEERQMLGNVQCQVNQFYSDFIRQAMGGYGGHGDRYLYFCEAQLLWDTMMARNLVEFLRKNQDYRVVVLAGSGHAWKFGIPRQMLEEEEISYRVILPEVFTRVDRTNVTKEAADYLWLDEGADGWTFAN